MVKELNKLHKRIKNILESSVFLKLFSIISFTGIFVYIGTIIIFHLDIYLLFIFHIFIIIWFIILFCIFLSISLITNKTFKKIKIKKNSRTFKFLKIIKSIMHKFSNFIKKFFLFFWLLINLFIFVDYSRFYIIDGFFKFIIFNLILFIPTLIFIILLILQIKGKIKIKTIPQLLSLQLLFMFLPFIFAAIWMFIGEGNFISANNTHNIKNYKKVLDRHSESHFPKELPSNARNVKFHYTNSLDFIECYVFFKTDKKTIETYEKNIKNISKKSFEFQSLLDDSYLSNNDNKRIFHNEIYVLEENFKKNYENPKIYYLNDTCFTSQNYFPDYAPCELIAIDKHFNSILFFYGI